ncbi:MAG: hypothetical protein WB785_24600 [Mycobacterium sp.]|uniref:hypothetical protein n=1 Tax=Mycobacterium sp. TaxID=1785 RepID=UPI003C63A758
MRVSAVAAGAVVAGGALLGAAQLGGLNPGEAFQPVQQRDVALAASPTFEESVQALLNALNIGTMGQLLGTLGTDHELVPPAPLDTASALSALLADLNPNDTTLGAAIPALGSQVGELLNTIFIGSTPIGSLPIDTLAGDLLGESATSATIQNLFDTLGLGSYAGLVDVIKNFNGTLLDPNLNPSDSLSDLLSSLLNTNTSTELLGSLPITVGNVTTTLGDADLNQLLGITSAQLAEPWDTFVDNLSTSGILSPNPTILGDDTLGELLTSLLPHGSALAPVVDGTEVAAFLDALGLFGPLG